MDIAGTLYNWNDKKGFGFVRPDNGDPEVFVHITSFCAHTQRPENGDILLFKVKTTDGKSMATYVRFAHEPKENNLELAAFKQRPIGSLLVGGLCFVYLMFFPLLIVVPIVISLITYLVYLKDKRAAQAEKQRTPEKTLHFLSLIGGWPGAFIAQTRLRHKLRKPSFMSVYWFTVILNIAALYLSKLRFVI